MWGNLGSELSPGVAVVSAILVVVVLAIALSLRNKITKTERGNEFIFWGKEKEEGELLEAKLEAQITDTEEESNEEDEEDETD